MITKEAMDFAKGAVPDVKKIVASLLQEGNPAALSKATAILALILRSSTFRDEAKFLRMLKVVVESLVTCPDISAEMKDELDRTTRGLSN